MGDIVQFRALAARVAPQSPDDSKRLIRLLIRDIAKKQGRTTEFDESFGRLKPEPRDSRLKASVGGFSS